MARRAAARVGCRPRRGRRAGGSLGAPPNAVALDPKEARLPAPRDLATAARGLATTARAAYAARGLEPRVVWILGSPRSGSTWLLNLLCALTGSAKLDEPLIGAHLALPFSALSGLPQPHDRLALDVERARPAYFFSDASTAVWQPALRTLLLRRFALALHGQPTPHRRTMVIVKEPHGSAAAPLLRSLLPRSRILFLVRDGRDVVDSSVDGASRGWISDQFGIEVDGGARRWFIEHHAHQWVQSVSAVRAAFDAHDPARRIRLTYEDLRKDTVTEITTILRWLGHDVAPARVSDVVSAMDFDALPAGKRGRGQFARAASPGLWRENFTASEIALLHGIMGPLLAELGYT